MSGLQAWTPEGLVPVEDARVSVFDRGLRGGEGVFETMRAYGTHVFRLQAHLNRARYGAEVIGFDLPEEDTLVDAVQRTVAVNHPVLAADAAVRLIVTPGPIEPSSPFPGRSVGVPTVVVTCQPLAIDPAIYTRGISVVTVEGDRPLPSVKSLSYAAAAVARRHAHARGADDALLLDRLGHVLEASSANLFAAFDGDLVTPPLDGGLLAGVTRATVMEVARGDGLTVREEQLSVADLLGADEAFVTASTRGLVPLVEVNGKKLGGGTPGQLSARLTRRYEEAVERERAAAG